MDTAADFAGCFERARRGCGLKYEAIAIMCGISRPRLMQCLTDGSFSMRKVWRLAQDTDGRHFVEALLQEMSLALGLREWDGVIAALLKATDAIVGGAAQAKATLRSEQGEQRRIA